MTQLLAVVLVCAATVAPADCTRDTATDLMVQPAPSAAPTACLLAGEAVVAGGALGRDMPPGAYLKIGCERRKG